MRFKCFSANFSCLIVRFSAKSLSTSYAWFVYVLVKFSCHAHFAKLLFATIMDVVLTVNLL